MLALKGWGVLQIVEVFMRDARLSVVVGTFNRLEALKRCVSSVLRQTRTPVVLYVTDAGSTDGSQEYLKSIACHQIVPVLVGKKLGQAKAYNDVFREVRTPYVAWLSDDNEIVNGGLDVAVSILDSRRRVGMVGLKVKDVQGPFVKAPYIGGISAIGILNVNQGVLRTGTLQEVGYFSETFGFYGIDPDLTAMVLNSGRDVVYTKIVAVHHYRDWPNDKSSPEYVAFQKNQQRSLDLYKRKYSGFGEDDRAWETKKRLWQWLREKLGTRYSINSHEPYWGGLFRDWHNAFSCRYVKALDPWLSLGRDFHLRQHMRPSLLPEQMPSDPILGAEEHVPNQRR